LEETPPPIVIIAHLLKQNMAISAIIIQGNKNIIKMREIALFRNVSFLENDYFLNLNFHK